LMGAGADVNASNNSCETTLTLAARNGHSGVVKVLCEAGADVNAKNNDGDTALSFAKDKNVAQLLKSAMVDAFAKEFCVMVQCQHAACVGADRDDIAASASELKQWIVDKVPQELHAAFFCAAAAQMDHRLQGMVMQCIDASPKASMWQKLLVDDPLTELRKVLEKVGQIRSQHCRDLLGKRGFFVQSGASAPDDEENSGSLHNVAWHSVPEIYL